MSGRYKSSSSKKMLDNAVVIVLTSMNKDLREFLGHGCHLPDERRDLHEVRPRSHHMHNPHSPEHNKQARALFPIVTPPDPNSLLLFPVRLTTMARLNLGAATVLAAIERGVITRYDGFPNVSTVVPGLASTTPPRLLENLESASGGYDAYVQLNRDGIRRRIDEALTATITQAISSEEVDALRRLNLQPPNSGRNMTAILDEIASHPAIRLQVHPTAVSFARDTAVRISLAVISTIGRTTRALVWSGEREIVATDFAAAADIGTASVDLVCRWFARTDATRTRVTFYLDTFNSEIEPIQPTQAAVPFYDVLHETIASITNTRLPLANRIELAPTISLFGPSGTAALAEPVERLDTGVLSDRNGDRQALAAAWAFSANTATDFSEIEYTCESCAYSVLHSNTSIRAIIQSLWHHDVLTALQSFSVEIPATYNSAGVVARGAGTVRVNLGLLKRVEFDLADGARGSLSITGVGDMSAQWWQNFGAGRQRVPVRHQVDSERPFEWSFSCVPDLLAQSASTSQSRQVQTLFEEMFGILCRPFFTWNEPEAPQYQFHRIEPSRGLFLGDFY